MEQLLELMSRLDVSQLGSREVEISVVTALQEVTRHQRTLRDVLARLQRRQNREEVSQLLHTEQEMEEGEQTLPMAALPGSCLYSLQPQRPHTLFDEKENLIQLLTGYFCLGKMKEIPFIVYSFSR